MSDEKFAEYYAQSADRLVAQLFLMTGDLEEARDCVQEAYARAWTRWRVLLRHGEDPVGWVRTVAWRIAVSGFRRRLAQARAVRRHGGPPDVPGPSADTVAVRDALVSLPQGQRAALVLHYYEGLSVEEIARVLSLSASGVKSRLARGRAALQPLLREASPPSDRTPEPSSHAGAVDD